MSIRYAAGFLFIGLFIAARSFPTDEQHLWSLLANRIEYDVDAALNRLRQSRPAVALNKLQRRVLAEFAVNLDKAT